MQLPYLYLIGPHGHVNCQNDRFADFYLEIFIMKQKTSTKHFSKNELLKNT